mmetsp:Transcript_21495/g.50899  ORF Transcript_21495/g.50899 Transcript_21495/m.50899 type:complete len:245 (-) Transcript_21495:117-851(-)
MPGDTVARLSRYRALAATTQGSEEATSRRRERQATIVSLAISCATSETSSLSTAAAARERSAAAITIGGWSGSMASETSVEQTLASAGGAAMVAAAARSFGSGSVRRGGSQDAKGCVWRSRDCTVGHAVKEARVSVVAVMTRREVGVTCTETRDTRGESADSVGASDPRTSERKAVRRDASLWTTCNVGRARGEETARGWRRRDGRSTWSPARSSKTEPESQAHKPSTEMMDCRGRRWERQDTG